jgi:phosphoribosylformylglycinamidine synthase
VGTSFWNNLALRQTRSGQVPAPTFADKTLDRFWIHDVIVSLYRPVKINVFVTPKKNVLDPQGAAVGHALESLGFKGLKSTRVGKLIELDLAAADTPEFRAQLDKLCRDLLSNPVIEDYRYEIQ